LQAIELTLFNPIAFAIVRAGATGGTDQENTLANDPAMSSDAA